MMETIFLLANFIFLKVASAAFMLHDFTIVSCGLISFISLSIMGAASIKGRSSAAMKMIGIGGKNESNPIITTMGAYIIVALLACTIINFFVVYGFSARVRHDLGYDYEYGQTIRLLAIIVVPNAIYGVLMMILAHRQLGGSGPHG